MKKGWHDTPVRPLPGLGGGPGWIDQWVPFHRSASGTGTWPYWVVFLWEFPTAVQLPARHDTLTSVLPEALGLGVGWTIQLAPAAAGTAAQTAQATAMNRIIGCHFFIPHLPRWNQSR